MEHPVIAFASTPPPPRTSRALSTIRRTEASAAELQAALDGVDAEIVAAEATVDALERERQGLLIAGADTAIDDIERKISVANRTVEALAAAKRQIPARLEARRTTEASVDQRVAKAIDRQR